MGGREQTGSARPERPVAGTSGTASGFFRELGQANRSGAHSDGSIRHVDERLLVLQEVIGRWCAARSPRNVRSSISCLALAAWGGATALQPPDDRSRDEPAALHVEPETDAPPWRHRGSRYVQRHLA